MSRFPVPLALLLTTALAAAAAAPAGAADTSNAASGVCPVRSTNTVERTVVVGVNLTNGRSSAAGKARCGVVGRVVRTLAGEGAERPETVQGYRCTPSVTGAKVTWACRYRGGRPITTITLDFAYRYAAGGR